MNNDGIQKTWPSSLTQHKFYLPVYTPAVERVCSCLPSIKLDLEVTVASLLLRNLKGDLPCSIKLDLDGICRSVRLSASFSGVMTVSIMSRVMVRSLFTSPSM